MNCPVCGKSMEHEIDQEMGVILEESYTCPDRCYGYEYEYGTTNIHVRGVNEIFGWNHNTSLDDVRAEECRINDAVSKIKATK